MSAEQGLDEGQVQGQLRRKWWWKSPLHPWETLWQVDEGWVAWIFSVRESCTDGPPRFHYGFWKHLIWFLETAFSYFYSQLPKCIEITTRWSLFWHAMIEIQSIKSLLSGSIEEKVKEKWTDSDLTNYQKTVYNLIEPIGIFIPQTNCQLIFYNLIDAIGIHIILPL